MKFSRQKILAEKILFIDGLSGSGKSLIGPLLVSLDKCEYWLYDHLYEEIIVLLANKKIDLDSAKSILKIHSDMNIYNLYLGRNINFRYFDHSGVQYGSVENNFKKRLRLKDGDYLVNKIIKKKLWLPLMTHGVLIYFSLFKKIFSDRNIHFISLSRNPVSLLKNFYKDNWYYKINNNPREIYLSYKKKKLHEPWFFALSKGNTFNDKYADYLYKYINYQEKLKTSNHSIIYYENFVRNPKKELDYLKQKLGSTNNITQKLFKKFKLPRIEKLSYEDDLNFINSKIKNRNLRYSLIKLQERYYNNLN